ncbi:MAG: NTP transferase domain-containing protein [Fimbriimonadaceae bacterium]|nr:NTP transferase domain-containing protein [Fimbriimonadaceae bacterium]
MKAVILAAGLGSRLFPVTQAVPKPLLPLANRPTLAYAFDRLKEIGVHDVCIVVGQMEAAMRDALGSGRAFDVRLSYVRQTEPKGLAHALGFAREFVGDEDFCLYLGDAVYSTGLVPAAEKFRAGRAANVNLVKEVPDPSRFGVANVQADRIVRLVEKPKVPESNLAMAGVYFFRSPIWDVLPGLPPSARGEYEITDAIQALVDRGESVLASVLDGEWFDTGTLDSFLETSRFLTDNGHLFGESARVEGEVGEHVVVGEGAVVRVGAIRNAVVLPGARLDCEGLVERAIVGGNVVAPSLVNTIAYGTQTRVA